MEQYIEEVKDVILEMKSKNRYWSQQEKNSDQIRTVRQANFLNTDIVQAIEEHLSTFNDDIWHLTEDFGEICQKHLPEFPSTHVFAVFTEYLFYGGNVRELL